MALVNVLLRFGLDSLFFGGHGFSLEGDVTGVGWATLLASMGLLLVGFILLFQAKRVPQGYLTTRPTFAGLGEYLRVGLGSGADSLIRNVAYFFMQDREHHRVH